MTMRLKISIVVPAFNEEKLIECSLQSIRDASSIFSRVGWEHEIIVCDNNSTDRTPELARQKEPASSSNPSIRSPGRVTLARRWRRDSGLFLWTRILFPAPSYLPKSRPKFKVANVLAAA